MPKFEDQLELIYASDRTEWRQWLAANHQTSSGVWLIYYKIKSAVPSVHYSEAVQEALCFGWIDSKVKSLDELRYQQIFTPRKAKSVWSKLNKQYIEELMAQGKMTKAGLDKIEAAKRDGSWTALDLIEALVLPADLAAALEANPIAQQNFAAFSNSSKKTILSWIGSAKRPETRSKRIKTTISAAAQNQNPLLR